MRPNLILSDPLSPQSIRLLLGDIELDEADYVELSFQAKSAQRVEKIFKRKFREAIFEAAHRILDDLAAGAQVEDSAFDFEHLIVENSVAAMKAGLRRPKSVPARMAKKTGMQTIFEMWDRWRRGKLTKRQRKNADTIKKTFLHTVKEFWKQNSENFRRGDSYDMGAARDAFHKRAKIPIHRAEQIVQTETTNFFNKSITTIYRYAEGVTHYLFVAIRDRRTSKWCTGFKKGGRDGLVYTKDAAVTRREEPSCHWWCRSQFLPLSISNPKHRILIEDLARRRENHSPYPLPKGWNS